jgi:hypothetical protein
MRQRIHSGKLRKGVEATRHGGKKETRQCGIKMFNTQHWPILPSFPKKDLYISQGEIRPRGGELRVTGTITPHIHLP